MDKEQRREYDRLYRATHAEERKVLKRTWREKHIDQERARKEQNRVRWASTPVSLTPEQKAIKHQASVLKGRNDYLRRLYGITVEDYETMLAAQDGRCAICQQPVLPDQRLSVDHDHSTQEVRGLLCSSCNLALGSFKDDVRVLEAAIQYLQHPSVTRVKRTGSGLPLSLRPCCLRRYLRQPAESLTFHGNGCGSLASVRKRTM